MPAFQILRSDLEPFADIPLEKAEAMIDDAMALAARVAPCILTDEFTEGAAAKAIIRGAILRWHEAGSGATVQQSAGPFGQTTHTTRRGMFWPSEIEQLQDLCQQSVASGAFTIDLLGASGIAGHSDICALVFGAAYCSCGADIGGSDGPLYEV